MTFPAHDPNYPQIGDTCTLEAITKAHVLLVIANTLSNGGNYADAAKILGVENSTLWRWRTKWGEYTKPQWGRKE